MGRPATSAHTGVGPIASRAPGCLTRGPPDGEIWARLWSGEGRLAVTPMVRKVKRLGRRPVQRPEDATSASTYESKGVNGDIYTTVSPTDPVHGAGRDRSLDVLTLRDRD